MADDPDDPLARQGADPAVLDAWPAMQEDVDALAAEFRDRGWDVIEIHPGDVVSLAPGEHDRWGLDVLTPDDELEAVAAAVEEAAFDELDVYRRVEGSYVFVLVVARDAPTERAILIPAYFRRDAAAPLRGYARERGEIHVHLRPLTRTPVITFSHDEPALFFPEDD